MPTVAWHDLGAVAGACTVCGADGALSMGEARSSRTLAERVRREHCPTPARFVTCADCGWRWPVRVVDTSADGVARRADPAAVEPSAPAVEPPARRVDDVPAGSDGPAVLDVLAVPVPRADSDAAAAVTAAAPGRAGPVPAALTVLPSACPHRRPRLAAALRR